MSQMSQVPQVSECRHLEMGRECGDFPDDQVTIFWRNIMALMDNFMAIRLGSRHDVFRVSNMNAHIMHTCIIYIVIHIFTRLFWNPHGKNIWTSIDFHFSMSEGDFVSFPKRSRQGAVRMTRREPAGRAQLDGKKFQSLEGCEMMADFLLKDMDMYIFKYNTHTVYQYILVYIYIYIHIFSIHMQLWGGLASSRSSYCIFNCLNVEAPVSQVEALQRRGGNLRLLVN